MGNIPLPALDLKPPQQPDMMGDVSKLMALKSMMGQQQMQQQEIQKNQQALKNQQATTEAMKHWDGKDYDALTKSVLDYGGDATAAQAIQKHGLDIKKTVSDIAAQDATTGSKNLETFIGSHKAIGDALEGIEQVPDAELHQKALDTIGQLAKAGIMDPQAAQQLMQGVQQVQDPKVLRDHIDVFAKSSMGAKAVAEQAKTAAETAKTNTEALLNQTKLDIINSWKQDPQKVLSQVDAIVPPDGPNATLNARTKSQVQFAMGNGDVDGAKAAIKMAADQVGAIEKETNPAVQDAKLHLATATKAAEQAITDGDPKAAAQLLINGTVAPSQLISSRKPAFAQQAFTAAATMQPGWSATKADADYKVASSPAQVAFFGSAKSLTDKGGTLDQLAAAGKDIPQNEFPVFNTVADAIKASTGSGPVAKYAAIALGVADDYAKVMGGGQGSDTSRTQALNIISQKQSPEQRAASIEGIRGAVGSQTKSRIGNNAVLGKMYGEGETQKQPNDFFSQFGGKQR